MDAVGCKGNGWVLGLGTLGEANLGSGMGSGVGEAAPRSEAEGRAKCVFCGQTSVDACCECCETGGWRTEEDRWTIREEGRGCRSVVSCP